MGKQAKVLIERNSDIAEFGEKDQRGAYSKPLTIAGERVDLERLPALSPVDAPKDSHQESGQAKGG